MTAFRFPVFAQFTGDPEVNWPGGLVAPYINAGAMRPDIKKIYGIIHLEI
jgi:hypothetical protein